MTVPLSLIESVEAGVPSPLLAEVWQLIGAARQWVASAVNAELTQLYRHIGPRIHVEALQGQRGEYSKQVVAELARQPTADFGKGWSEQQLRHCLRLAGVFADAPILSTVRRELSWSYRNTSPHRHRAQPCRPSCARPLPLPARKCSVMRTNRTLLVLQAAASDA